MGDLLTALGRMVSGSPATGLPLPGGLTVTAAGNDPLVVTVATDPSAPLLGAVGFSLGLGIDAARHATATGSVSVEVPLGGGWPSATVVVEATAAGVRVAIAPAGQPPIELLPHFSGFGALAAAASALLPALLGTIDSELSPPGAAHQAALDLATALDLYYPAGGSAAHADTWAAVVRTGWLELRRRAARTAAVTAAIDVLTQIGVPGTLTALGASVQWASGALAVRAGWGTGSAELSVACTDLTVAGSPVHLWLAAAVSAGSGAPAVTADAAVQLDATADVGFAFTPGIRASLDTSGPGPVVRARLLPLGRTGRGRAGRQPGPVVRDRADARGNG